MWTTVALMTMTLAPAQAGKPEFKNERFTYGIHGQARKDDKFLPGDVVCLTYDVGNMTVSPVGRVQYEMGMEVIKKGQQKAVFKRAPQALEAYNSLGGTSFPSFALYIIPRDAQAPGDYTMKVTVQDRAVKAGKSTTLSKTFTVATPRFGFTQVHLTTFRGDPTPPVAVPGQQIWVHYRLVDFGFDKKTNLTDLDMQIRVLDSDGKPALTKPFAGNIKSDQKAAPGEMRMREHVIDVNRPGKFKIELKATDNTNKKTIEQTLDLTVLEVK